MVDREALRRAVDELYSVDAEEFLARRTALASAARQAGDRATAKEITGLRKPTRSAAVLNGLARSDPDRVDALLELGTDLRDAERSVDAGRLRELTGRRRKLIDDLTRATFRIVGDKNPSSAVKDEVVSTLTAALADADVADQLRSGTLVKPARWEGFGFGGGPDLMIVPAVHDAPEKPRPAARKSVSTDSDAAGSTSSDDTEQDSGRKSDGGRSKLQDKEQTRRDARARAEQDRREAIADARRRADEADAAVTEARQAEQEQHDRLRMLEEQVVDARRRLDDARLAVRRAEVQQRKAAHALSRVDR